MATALWLVLLLTFCDPGVAGTNDNDARQGFCPPEARLDLSNLTRNDSGFFLESGDFFPTEAARIIDGEQRGCVCDLKPCLALCPSQEENMRNYVAIPRIYTTNLTIDDVADASGPEKWFHIFSSSPCPGELASYLLEPAERPEDKFYLLRNGSLFLPEAQLVLLNLDVYCLQLDPNGTSYMPRVCIPSTAWFEDPEALTHLLQDIGGLVSVLFIIVTLIVYSVLPELRNIHGRTLSCYLGCLAVANIALAALRLPGPDYRKASSWCFFLGFTIYFSFISCFLWLNVICFDLWWRIRIKAQHERKKLLWYSLYVWGISLALTAFCIGMEFSPSIPESLVRPGFRFGACWFETQKARALYYFAPLGLIILCNTCLFVLTSVKIYQHEKSTRYVLDSEGSGSHNNDRKWFKLHLKLFVVMGICWSTEPISWFWEEAKWLRFVLDLVNALQGIPIFFMFVCKKNIWLSLKERYGDKNLRATGTVMGSSNVTRSTRLLESQSSQ